MLTVFFTLGAIGTLFGGRLADRFGNRNVTKVGLLMLFPVLLIWLHTTNIPMAVAMLVPLAIVYYAPFSGIVVLGQQYLPNRVAFASGVTLGLAVSIGGVVAPLLGKWADVHGVQSALLWVSVLPLICAVIALTLPAPPKEVPRN
jgi:FSR family fosmidomycin resistance protein-like MFS transporter